MPYIPIYVLATSTSQVSAARAFLCLPLLKQNGSTYPSLLDYYTYIRCPFLIVFAFFFALHPCRPGPAQNAIWGVLGRYGTGVTTAEVESAFNQVEWTQQQVNSFASTVVNGNAYTFCINGLGVSVQFGSYNYMPPIYMC